MIYYFTLKSLNLDFQKIQIKFPSQYTKYTSSNVIFLGRNGLLKMPTVGWIRDQNESETDAYLKIEVRADARRGLFFCV